MVRSGLPIRSMPSMDRPARAIRRKIGRYPNMLELGALPFRSLRRHPKIKEQFKYVSAESVTTAMLAQYFDIEMVVVGRAVYLPENANDDADAQDVWGDDAVLCYKPTQTSFRVPAFGYTYRLSGYPLVEAPYYERNRKSWVYPVTEEYRPYVSRCRGRLPASRRGVMRSLIAITGVRLDGRAISRRPSRSRRPTRSPTS